MCRTLNERSLCCRQELWTKKTRNHFPMKAWQSSDGFILRPLQWWWPLWSLISSRTPCTGGGRRIVEESGWNSLMRSSSLQNSASDPLGCSHRTMFLLIDTLWWISMVAKKQQRLGPAGLSGGWGWLLLHYWLFICSKQLCVHLENTEKFCQRVA